MKFYHDDCDTELDHEGFCPKCRYYPDVQSLYGKKAKTGDDGGSMWIAAESEKKLTKP